MDREDGHLLQVFDLHVERENYEILHNVNLVIDRGTVHVVLGLNGSGKSTLAYTLMGSGGYVPSEGKIWFDGELINSLNIAERAQRGITLGWQEPARFEGLTVARYISLGMGEPDENRMREALEAVALPPDTYLPRYVDAALSGGERKRIELASVYAMRPQLAILDEPDSGIDSMTLDDIAALIERMAREGTTVLVITHRDQIVQIADAASLICEGEIVRTGKPEQVIERYDRCCRECDRAEQVEMEGDYERL
ncbi:MAG: ATP-binding cassette domain-containing protein [Anaerolineales bacterium]